MADRATHEYDCMKKMGDPMTEVHKMMDSQFRRYFHRHRFVYHHWEGIKAVARHVSYAHNKDYDLCYEAGVHHVKLDFYSGFQLPIPNAEDYIGGEGDWPMGKEWNCLCPWSTLGCDKHFSVTKEMIEEVKRRLENGSHT